MKKYIIPLIDCLIFDEEEEILSASVAKTRPRNYAAGALNDAMSSSNVNANSVTTVNLESVMVK